MPYWYDWVSATVLDESDCYPWKNGIMLIGLAKREEWNRKIQVDNRRLKSCSLVGAFLLSHSYVLFSGDESKPAFT